MNSWQQGWLVLRNDLRLEARRGEAFVQAGLLALLTTLVAALSYYLDRNTALRVAPGALWTATTFASVLTATRVWSRERDGDAYAGLLLAGVDPTALYLAKVSSCLVVLTFVEILELLVVILFFHLDPAQIGWVVPLFLMGGTLGFSLLAVLFAAIGLRRDGQEFLVTMMLMPLTTPALLAGVVATREHLAGAQWHEIRDWLQILGALDLGALALGLLISPRLLR